MAMSSAVGDHNYVARYYAGERERVCVCICVLVCLCVCVESGYESIRSVCVPQDQLLLDQVPQNQLLFVREGERAMGEFHVRCHSYST